MGLRPCGEISTQYLKDEREKDNSWCLKLCSISNLGYERFIQRWRKAPASHQCSFKIKMYKMWSMCSFCTVCKINSRLNIISALISQSYLKSTPIFNDFLLWIFTDILWCVIWSLFKRRCYIQNISHNRWNLLATLFFTIIIDVLRL